ncbi:MAG: hypothetical protein FD157_2486 [Rhodocyclaceae bacterium]|nr:MAG: hypothetical protein FD157_2486 [Rhodocyclaceae bacterium]TND00197.1 MAG: hypothetical protein FD118_3381 [Rhodocyclaceae bacterium]
MILYRHDSESHRQEFPEGRTALALATRRLGCGFGFVGRC